MRHLLKVALSLSIHNKLTSDISRVIGEGKRTLNVFAEDKHLLKKYVLFNADLTWTFYDAAKTIRIKQIKIIAYLELHHY